MVVSPSREAFKWPTNGLRAARKLINPKTIDDVKNVTY